MCDTKASIVFPVVPGRSLGFGNFFRTILVRPFPTGPPFLAMALPFFPIVAFLCCSAAVDVSICREATGIYTRAHSPSQRKREGERDREKSKRFPWPKPTPAAQSSRQSLVVLLVVITRLVHASPRVVVSLVLKLGGKQKARLRGVDLSSLLGDGSAKSGAANNEVYVLRVRRNLAVFAP